MKASGRRDPSGGRAARTSLARTRGPRPSVAHPRRTGGAVRQPASPGARRRPAVRRQGDSARSPRQRPMGSLRTRALATRVKRPSSKSANATPVTSASSATAIDQARSPIRSTTRRAPSPYARGSATHTTSPDRAGTSRKPPTRSPSALFERDSTTSASPTANRPTSSHSYAPRPVSAVSLATGGCMDVIGGRTLEQRQSREGGTARESDRGDASRRWPVVCFLLVRPRGDDIAPRHRGRDRRRHANLSCDLYAGRAPSTRRPLDSTTRSQR